MAIWNCTFSITFILAILPLWHWRQCCRVARLHLNDTIGPEASVTMRAFIFAIFWTMNIYKYTLYNLNIHFTIFVIFQKKDFLLSEWKYIISLHNTNTNTYSEQMFQKGTVCSWCTLQAVFCKDTHLRIRCVTSYIIMRHTAVRFTGRRIHPTDFEPAWMSLKPWSACGQAAVWGAHTASGAICLVVEDPWTELLILRRRFKQECRRVFRGPGSMGVTAGW